MAGFVVDISAEAMVDGVNGPPVGDAPLTVTFSAVPDEYAVAPVSYVWQFGDGAASGSGVTTSYTYGTPGTYTASVLATDNGGEIGVNSVAVTVGAAGPEAPEPPAGLAAVWVEDEDDEFDYATDWKEAMDGFHQPGGGSTFGPGSQEATLVGFIPFNKVRSARRYFLGFSWADDEAPWRLHREPPAPHPTDPQLRAVTFSAAGFGIEGQPDNPSGEAYLESDFADQNGDSMYYGGYQYAICTVKYKSFGRVRFLPDEYIGDYTDEFKRWTEYGAAGNLELLQADNGSTLWFAQGPGAGKPFPVPVAIPLAKTALLIKWMSVPHNYLSDDPVVLNPVKVLRLLGKVNLDYFLGYYPGTLAMLDAPTFEPVLFPVSSADPLDYVLGGWDVTIRLSLFDPDRGYDTTLERGHQLMPWKGTGPGDPYAGKFFLCTWTGDPGDRRLLGEAAFWPMFSHAGSPD